jgi:Cu/Ag efflux pump CusA
MAGGLFFSGIVGQLSLRMQQPPPRLIPDGPDASAASTACSWCSASRPRGLLGVVAALLLAGKPLGFVAILGVLALTGMIARNVVILIEQIEAERKEGTDAWNAVIKGALSRFRPITLTAISTVLGMIPIASTIFWGPMAFAIMGGLLVATVLTLIFLPALYVACFRVKEPRTQEGVLAAEPRV